jgi:hypothetical protein
VTKRFAAALVLAGILGGVIAHLIEVREAHAIIPYSAPLAAYGSLTLAAATATKVPASPITGRNRIIVCNLDTASVFCGWDSAVTNTTGLPVFINSCQGDSLDLSFGPLHTTPLGTPVFGGQLYCYSLAGTAANGLRYMELR